jgi:hypothetical protein
VVAQAGRSRVHIRHTLLRARLRITEDSKHRRRKRGRRRVLALWESLQGRRNLRSPQDPWIVIPKPSRKPPSPLSQLADQGMRDGPETGETRQGPGSGTLTIGRNTLKVNAQLSRVVDAVIDVQSPTVAATPSDYQATLAHRGLRPRGLSDSSIHTTFLNHAEDRPGPGEGQQPGGGGQTDQEPTSSGMLVSFGKRVLGLRSVSSSFGPLSRGATPKPSIPKLTYTTLPTSGSNSIPVTVNPPGNTSAALSRMRPPICPTNRVQAESDDDDLGSPAISRETFFPIAGARTNVDSWSRNEPYDWEHERGMDDSKRERSWCERLLILLLSPFRAFPFILELSICSMYISFITFYLGRACAFLHFERSLFC